MDRNRTGSSLDLAIGRLAECLRDQIGAERVLLFGSQASGMAKPDSDYGLIIVAGRFRSVHKLERGIGLRKIF